MSSSSAPAAPLNLYSFGKVRTRLNPSLADAPDTAAYEFDTHYELEDSDVARYFNRGEQVFSISPQGELESANGSYNVTNILEFPGADPTGTSDSTAAFTAAIAAIPEGWQIFIPANSTFIVDGAIVNRNVGMRGMGLTSVLKHKSAATSNMFSCTVANSCVFENFKMDGNKAGQTLTGADHTRYACLLTYSDGMRIRDVTFQNYALAGINDRNTQTKIFIERVNFLEGAEHGGTYRATGRGTEQSCAISVSAIISSNINPHWYISDCRVIQSSSPSASGMAPGGFIFAGVLANNAKITAHIRNCYFYKIGQTWPRVGDANHIGPIDFYEACVGCSVIDCVFLENEYGAIKCQNSFSPRIIGNYIKGHASGILESDGVAGILVDINRVLGTASTDYGRAVVMGNQIIDMENSAGIRIAGRGTATADAYQDVLVGGNYVDNPSNRAAQFLNCGGKITSFNNIYIGAGPTASSGSVEVQNLISGAMAIFRGDSIEPYANHGLYSTSGISGSLFFSDCYIGNGGAGTTCLVASSASRLAVKGCSFDGTGGSAWQITGAGTLEWYSNNAIATTRSITWANVSNAEGDLEGTGDPNGVVRALRGRATFRRTDGGAGTTLYVKETDAGAGTPDTVWAAK